MIPRRLHLQVYATVVAALAFTVILTGLGFALLDDGTRPSEIAAALAQQTVALSLPPAGAPDAAQVAVLEEIAAGRGLDLALYDADGRLIGRVGERPAPSPVPGSALRLADGRRIVAHVPFPSGPGLLALPLLLACVALAVAAASWPLVRRLTGRLERLGASVERMGGGDLSARAPVEGRDEVAALAGSFNHAADRIERLVDAHRALLADTSHELRTPLARICLGLEAARDTGDVGRLAGAEADIVQLDRLIDEILTLSRLDAAPIAVEPGIDLLGLAAEECARMGVEVEGGGGAPALVDGDRDLLMRLVRNLVANAQTHGAPPVEVVVASRGEDVRLTVRDGGAGIDPAERERVFDRFRRGVHAGDGYGLGLPLVRRIATAHGGTAEIAPGPASAAVVTFPRSRDAPPA